MGEENSYVSLYAPKGYPHTSKGFRKGAPLNHLGVLVDDIDAVEARVVKLGLKPFSHGNYDPGKRFYLMDPDGIEIEVVSYA